MRIKKSHREQANKNFQDPAKTWLKIFLLKIWNWTQSLFGHFSMWQVVFFLKSILLQPLSIRLSSCFYLFVLSLFARTWRYLSLGQQSLEIGFLILCDNWKRVVSWNLNLLTKSLGGKSSLFNGLSTYLLDTVLHRNQQLSDCQPEDNTILSELLTIFLFISGIGWSASRIQSLRIKTAEFKTIISMQL